MLRLRRRWISTEASNRPRHLDFLACAQRLKIDWLRAGEFARARQIVALCIGI